MNPIITDLDLAVQDLNGISQGSHSDSKKYTAVLKAIAKAQSLTHAAYEQPLDLMTRKGLEQAYDELHGACLEYLDGKGPKRFSSYGQGRLHCVQEIDRIISLDLKGLSALPTTGSTTKTLKDILAEARAADVNVDDPTAVHTVGGQMSQRIPLQVAELSQDRAGFFTGASQVDFGRLFSEMRKKDRYAGLGPILDKIGSDPNTIGLQIEEALEYYVREYRKTGHKNVNQAAVLETMKKDGNIWRLPVFQQILLNHGLPVEELRKLYADTEGTKAYAELIGDIIDQIGPYMMNHKYALIPDGEDLSKRNVGMTRVGDLLGMKGLIARAETMSLNVGSETKQGVFMEKAVGEDISHLTLDSSMAKNPEKLSMDSASLTRQLSDLQVLDYLCGNIDRHMGNVLYHTEEIDGKTVVTGITGIDNDMSFGLIDGADKQWRSRLVRPEDMMFMRQSTADAVKGLSKESLALALQDLNFTPEEVAAAQGRLEALQKRIRLDQDYFRGKDANVIAKGHIHILPDDQFDQFSITAIAAAMGEEVQAGRQRANYFYNASFVPGMVQGKATRMNEEKKTGKYKPDKGISYAAATGSWKYEQDTRPISYSSMKDAYQELADIAEMLEEADFKIHRDSGSYRWMKESLEKLTAKTAKLAEMAEKGQTGDLSREDVEELDRLYRELNKAGAAYQKTHQGKRQSEMGRVRQDMARAMTELRAPHGPQTKTRVSVKDMPEAKAKKSKTSEGATKRKTARKKKEQEKKTDKKATKTAGTPD